MTILYPKLCYYEVCYKETALYFNTFTARMKVQNSFLLHKLAFLMEQCDQGPHFLQFWLRKYNSIYFT